MQNLASNQNSQSIQLYRVCYQCKATGEIRKANGIDLFEDAQKKVHEFNTRYGEDFQYFVERVNINGVEREQLLRLVNEGKLPLSQLI
jgi:hypothetical protein